MADILNLNRARKRKRKADAERQAAENRIRFGRSKQERARDQTEADVARERLDGHQRLPED